MLYMKCEDVVDVNDVVVMIIVDVCVWGDVVVCDLIKCFDWLDLLGGLVFSVDEIVVEIVKVLVEDCVVLV